MVVYAGAHFFVCLCRRLRLSTIRSVWKVRCKVMLQLSLIFCSLKVFHFLSVVAIFWAHIVFLLVQYAIYQMIYFLTLPRVKNTNKRASEQTNKETIMSI